MDPLAEEHGHVEQGDEMVFPATPPRAYSRQTPMLRFSQDSHNNDLTQSPTSTVNELPTVCESPTEIKRVPYPNGLGALSQAQPIFKDGYTAEPAKLVRKPIECTFPSLAPRYEQTIAIPSNLGPWKLKPCASLAIHDDRPVPDWKLHTHPEGQPYFQNVSKDRRFRFLTEADLTRDSLLDEVNLFASEFERRAKRFPDLSSEVEVVLQPTEKLWLYYMVDVDRRSVFWIDECTMDECILPPKFGLESIDQLRHVLDFEFWQHIEYFPSHRQVIPGVLDELMGLLLHGHIDVLTSLTSHSPYSEEELQSMMGSVKHMMALHKRNAADTYVVTASARLMALYANERYFNFYGFQGARLSVDQSVRGHRSKDRSWLMKTLSPLLFNSPETHLERLETLWIDETIKGRLWKSFQSKLEKDWESFVLYATVLLNANVAFLAIPFVESNNGPFWMSPSAVCSQVSIIASLGSIIIGLLLIRQLRISAKDSAEDAIAFLGRRNHPRLGLETMAIQYSLPYALLMWGMTTFLAAVMVMCFFNVAGYGTLSKRLIYGCVWLFVCLLILWTIITGWETTRRRVLFAGPRRLLASLLRKGKPEEKTGSVSDEEVGDDDDDARSAKSIRTSRARTAVEGASGKSWKLRLRRMAERPRRLTWRSMTMDTVFIGKKNSRSSTLTPASSSPSFKVEKEAQQSC